MNINSKINSPNDNIYTALGVAQNEKFRVWALGKGARLKSKLHSLPQADRTWKPINVIATHLGKRLGQRIVSVLELVPNIGIFAWGNGTLLHSRDKNRK